MKETVEVIRTEEKELSAYEEEGGMPARTVEEPDYILRTQFFVCLFIAGILYFAYRQGGTLWQELSATLAHILEDGVTFSGQEELTRFTDEVRGLFGELVEAFLPVK